MWCITGEDTGHLRLESPRFSQRRTDGSSSWGLLHGWSSYACLGYFHEELNQYSDPPCFLIQHSFIEVPTPASIRSALRSLRQFSAFLHWFWPLPCRLITFYRSILTLARLLRRCGLLPAASQSSVVLQHVQVDLAEFDTFEVLANITCKCLVSTWGPASRAGKVNSTRGPWGVFLYKLLPNLIHIAWIYMLLQRLKWNSFPVTFVKLNPHFNFTSIDSKMSEEKDILSLPSPTLSHENHAKNLDRTSSSSEREYEPHIPYQDSQRAQDVALPAHPDLWWSRTKHLLREPLSEFFGVFVIILFGNG